MINLLKAWALRWAAVFVPAVWLCYPWPSYLLPHPGKILCYPAAAVARAAGTYILSLSPSALYDIQSDSTGLYVHTLNAALGAALVATGWTVWRRPAEPWLRPAFVTALRYLLAVALLAYGLNKIFKHQFFLPESNTLYTRLGDIPRDLLYWSTMGVSRPYSIFLGLAEVVPALLLLFRRTARAGAWMAVAVMVNVAAVNFCYDISVKGMSIFLLLVAMLAALLHSGRDRRAGPGKPRWLGLCVKMLLIGLVLSDALWPYVRSGNFNDDAAPRPLLHGGYEVVAAARDSSSGSRVSLPVARLYVHRRGYLVVEDERGHFVDYEMELDTAGGWVRLYSGENQSTGTLRYERHDDTLLLTGRIFDADSVTILTRSLPWRELPLLRDEFHWTVDE